MLSIVEGGSFLPKIIKGGRKKGVGFCIISLKIKGGNIPTKKAPPLRKKAPPLKSDPLANLPLLSQSVTWDAGCAVKHQSWKI